MKGIVGMNSALASWVGLRQVGMEWITQSVVVKPILREMKHLDQLPASAYDPVSTHLITVGDPLARNPQRGEASNMTESR